jgi:rod shape-determining protein MreB
VLQHPTRFELAIDVGTAATRLHVAPRLTPLVRPSTVWRSGGTRAALRGGVIVDSDAATAVLRELLRSVPRRGFRGLRALACVPTDASPDERAALVESVLQAGARSVAIVPEPFAAAAGAGLDIASPQAQLVVDIGEGVTDCAIVRGGTLVASQALRVAVADLRFATREWIEVGAGVRVSPVEAERVLREVGVGPLATWQRTLRVVGSPLCGAGPVRGTIEIDALHDALDPVVDQIVACVGHFVAKLPGEFADEIGDSGICLSGGGALLAGMLERLVGETAMGVWRARDPLRAVIDGARRIASLHAPIPAWH